MASIKSAKQMQFLQTVTQRMGQAASMTGQLKQTLLDTNANWQGFVAISDEDEVTAAGVEFAQETAAAWATAKPDLIAALSVLAGGMGVTLADVLAELGE